MNLLLNILGYFLLLFSIELLLYVFCILLTIKEENYIDFNTLFEDFKSYNGSASVSNKFKSINIFFILICVILAIFGISIFFITKS